MNMRWILQKSLDMETALPGCKQRSLNQLTEVACAESCVVLYHGIFIDLTKSRTFRAILFILTHISCSFSDLQIVEVFASVCKCLHLYDKYQLYVLYRYSHHIKDSHR